jgi:HSP20 family protein
MRQEMEQLFRRFFGVPAGAGRGAGPSWEPRVDIEETDTEMLFKVDLPGIDAKDVDLAVTEGMLVLRGERKEPRGNGKTFHQTERFVGPFYREIPLPPGTDSDRIDAASARGVLTITVPKKPEVQTKKIAIKSQD